MNMLPKVYISRFKKFSDLEIDLNKDSFIVGPNNSGKTTILQAVAFAAEIAEIWFGRFQKANFDYQHANASEIDVLSSFSMGLELSHELWHKQDTQNPIIIKIVTDKFDVGFSLQYIDVKTSEIRPLSETQTADLEAYVRAPFKAIYIPSLSGLDTKEPKYDDATIRVRLGRGQGGTILRSLLSAISRDETKWESLQESLQILFDNAELSKPSGADPIQVQYRHSPKKPWYGLINASSGFLQTVLVQSALLYSDAQLFLIDEPDAHLHVLLKESMYRMIMDHCVKNDCRALIATHSSRLIDAAAKTGEQNLSLVTSEGLRPVKQGDAKELLNIPFIEIVLAETTQRILYIEGSSDLHILRAWATALNHPTRPYLENPFHIETAERKGKGFPTKHYRALKAQVPTLQALDIRDPNGNENKSGEGLNPEKLRQKRTKDIQLVYWFRREIESYLLHPETLKRFLTNQMGNEAAQRFVEDQFSRAMIQEPFENSNFYEQGKRTVKNFLAKAGVNLKESEYSKIACCMHPDEIHPDVKAMLDIVEIWLMDETP